MRYIAAADAGDLRYFPLTVRFLPSKTVPQPDHQLLLVGQNLFNGPKHFLYSFPTADPLQKVPVITHHIHQRKRRPIRAGFNIVRQRNILAALPLRTEVHKDFICYPPPNDF